MLERPSAREGCLETARMRGPVVRKGEARALATASRSSCSTNWRPYGSGASAMRHHRPQVVDTQPLRIRVARVSEPIRDRRRGWPVDSCHQSNSGFMT